MSNHKEIMRIFFYLVAFFFCIGVIGLMLGLCTLIEVIGLVLHSLLFSVLGYALYCIGYKDAMSSISKNRNVDMH